MNVTALRSQTSTGAVFQDAKSLFLPPTTIYKFLVEILQKQRYVKYYRLKN